MPDPSEPVQVRPRQDGVSINAAISRALVAEMKEFFGKGPESAKSYLVDDLLFVVMRGGITTAEDTMIEAGQHDLVRQFRLQFEEEMRERLTTMIEEIVGRKVVTYQSQILFDPEIAIEIFVFDGPVEGAETTEVVRAD
jgi:uncharacterized protein YbcI